MKIISIILLAQLGFCVAISMESNSQKSPRKNSIMSALASKLSLESQEDTAAAQLKASKKRAKKNKAKQVQQKWEEYYQEKEAQCKCLTKRGYKTEYLIEETLLKS